jgi:hypothetical protein
VHEQVTIEDSDELYRLIYPDYFKLGHVSDSAYKSSKKPDPEISVYVAKMTSVGDVLATRAGKGHYLGVMIARCPRELGLTIEYAPEPGSEQGTPDRAHALILGVATMTMCNQLAFCTCVPGDRASIVQPAF